MLMTGILAKVKVEIISAFTHLKLKTFSLEIVNPSIQLLKNAFRFSELKRAQP